MIERRMPISWSAIQALHEPDLERHWVRCRDELGLDCPLEVFEELFFEHHGDAEFGALYRAVDWSAVAWTETELSGCCCDVLPSIAAISTRWTRRVHARCRRGSPMRAMPSSSTGPAS